MARYVLPVVGAAVGFVVGGPSGAMWGWQLGSGAGMLLDPQTIKGPSIGDLAQQTSQEGVPRPIVFGTSQPMAGNVIATSEPNVVTRSEGGKGGPKVETQSVYRTYAIRICEGPIDGVLRIWRNNVLVYDARPDGDLGDDANGFFLHTARFFLGTYDQMPSPDLEAVYDPIYGAGTTPAHRGTAYMVMANEDLTDLRGAIPQWQFQVSRGRRVPVVANGVVWPWASGAVSDPRHPLGNYTYSTNNTLGYRAETGGGSWCTGSGASIVGAAGFESLAAAITALNGEWAGVRSYDLTPFAYSANAHFNLTFNFTSPPTSGGAPSTGTRVEAAPYQRWIWLHHAITGEEPDFLAGGVTDEEVFLDPATEDGTRAWYTPMAAALWTGWPNAFVVRKNIGEQDSTWQFGVQNITGGIGPTCGTHAHSAYVPASVRVELQPGPPTEGAQLLSGTFHALRSFVPVGGTANGNPSAFPLDPVIAQEDARYDDQDFWEAAYAEAVENDDMEPGLVYGVDYPTTQNYAYFYYDSIEAETIPVQDIVAEICARVGLTQYDMSELEGLECWGLTVTNQYPAFTALQALGQLHMFDGANIDAQVRFVRRGADVVATIPYDDFVDADEMGSEETERQDAIAVPRVMHLSYFDINGGLTTDKQSSERPGDRRSTGEQSLSSAVLMDADQAAKMVAIQHKVGIEELRGERDFALPDKYLNLTPTDNIFLEGDGVFHRIRLLTVEVLDGYQQYKGVHDRQSTYTSNVQGIPPATQTPPPSNVVGPTLLEILDIHILRDADDNIGLSFYGAVSGLLPAWQGALIELSLDGGANYVESSSVSAASIIGELQTILPDHPQEIPDRTNTARVEILSPDAELLATTLAGMQNRQNLALIGNELVNFAEVEEVSPTVWDISVLLRGRKGSATAEHADGDRFVLLERSLLAVAPANLSDVGRTFTFRATSFGGSAEDATIVSVTYTGRTQMERAVGYLAARRDGANVVVSWQGVGRLGAGVNVAHGVRFGGYRVTYSDGVAPDIVATTNDQQHTQDVSALSGPLTIRVEQMNDLMGAGPATEVTVP